MDQKKLSLGTAKWLLTGARALIADPELKEWGGLKRSELFWLITDITGREVIDEAIQALSATVEQGISPTIPPELDKLVEELDEYQKNSEQGHEASEEQIRQLRTSIVSAQLEEQHKGDLYVAKEETQDTPQPVAPISQEVQPAPAPTEPPGAPFSEEPITYRRPLPSRPTPAPATAKQAEAPKEPSVVERITGQIQPPPATTSSVVPPAPSASSRPATPGYVPPVGEQATKAVFVVKKSVAQPLLRRLSNAPTRILRNVIAVGQEAVGQGPDAAQKAYASKLLNQGVTSTSFRQAVNKYVKGTPGERGVIDALFKQADVLAEHEASHPYLTRVTQSLYPAAYNQILIANQAVEAQPGESVENYRTLIDSLGGQVTNFEYWKPGMEVRAVGTNVPQVITQEAETAERGLADRAFETAERINQAKFAAKAARVAAPAVRTGLSALGSALSGIGSGVATIAGGTAAAGGAAVAGGAAIATAPAWVPVALIAGVIILLVVGVGFINNTHQSAYLGAQIAIEESPFISVSKTAPKTTFTNDELPQKVEFKIVVTTKQGKLTNVRVSDSFTLSGTSGTTLPQNSWSVDEIETSWEQVFEVTLPAGIKDSLVINNVTVTADVENQPTQRAISSLVLIVGEPPQDCPAIWPVNGTVAQGPNGSFSHSGIEAIDINNSRFTPIQATHRGTVEIDIENERPNYCPVDKSKWNSPGRTVLVTGVCQGKAFKSRYAHLNTIDVSAGQQITAGTKIGTMGDSGCANSVHLHYQFNGLQMAPPFISKPVSRGCVGITSCNVSIP